MLSFYLKKEWVDVITSYLDVKPVEINSALVSAQNRQRYYWTNIAEIPQPEDLHIYLKDILITNNTIRIPEYGNGEKSRPLTCHYSNNFGGWFDRITDPNPNKQQIDILAQYMHSLDRLIKISESDFAQERGLIQNTDGKCSCLLARDYKDPKCVFTQIPFFKEQKTEKFIFEVKDKKVIIYDKEYTMDLEDGYWCFRKLTPIECERLQTLPDNYTDGISNSQRYKALGNGWTVNVIAHIFSFLRK